MRVLLIGGTKFIGPHVASQLLAQGNEVWVYHRGEHENEVRPEVRHIHDPNAAMPVLQFPPELAKSSFDVVIHMIAMGQDDARAAVECFRGRAGRLVALSSGDVYQAYGRFTGLETGPADNEPLVEESPLRQHFFPYRAQAKSSADLLYSYEKILMEREALNDPRLPSTVLRLPKVYGREENSDLRTVHAFRNHLNWRWTHGYVENVAAAVVLAATQPSAANRIYNVGEEVTPTVAQRLAGLPMSSLPTDEMSGFNFEQDIVYDTSRIREELGYREIVSYAEGLRRTLSAGPGADAPEMPA